MKSIHPRHPSAASAAIALSGCILLLLAGLLASPAAAQGEAGLEGAGQRADGPQQPAEQQGPDRQEAVSDEPSAVVVAPTRPEETDENDEEGDGDASTGSGLTVPPTSNTLTVGPATGPDADTPAGATLTVPPADPDAGGSLAIPPASGWEILGDDAPRGRRARARHEERATILLGYREVLMHLAADRRRAALDTLMEFETAVLSNLEPDEIQELFDGEVEVILWLGSKDVESLIPLLDLHHAAYLAYVERGQSILAGHASRLAASLADLYAREGDSEGSRILGARALASLGIYSRQIGMKVESVALLLKALEHDPRSEAALLGLATTYEWHGQYEDAVRMLGRLLEAYPEHREGHLRRAIHHRRAGDHAAARELLSELLAGPADERGETWEDDWITVLAHQELARIHTEAGRLDQAARVLGEGMARLSDAARLRVQLALVEERDGSPGRSLALIEGLPEADTRPEPSPRRRYGMGPQEAYRRAQTALAEGAEIRVGRLADVMALTSEAGAEDPATTAGTGGETTTQGGRR